MAAAVYALPCNNRAPLDELLKELGLENSIVHMQAQADNAANMQKLVMSRWKLDDLRQRYTAFTSDYLEARKALQNEQVNDAHSMFLLRVLLLHEYRKIFLNDPELPAAMLPVDWEGNSAQSLTAEIYRSLATPTADWVNRELLSADGNLQGGSDILKTRFPK